MLSIRPAVPSDAHLLTTLVRELAEYERLSHELNCTEEDIARDGFGPAPKFRAVIAVASCLLVVLKMGAVGPGA